MKTEPVPSASPHLNQIQEHGGRRGHSKHLESIHIQAAHLEQRYCYGRLSSFYFVGRLSFCLGLPPNQLTPDGLMQMDQSFRESLDSDASLTEVYLSKAQERYFLHLFFPSYNVYYPIIDQTEFMQHYQSLWMSPTARKSSALVDIVLALSMQYADALLPRDYAAIRNSIEGIDHVNVANTGRKFYRRCQLLLTDELEGPSITTLQCHFFSVIYLSNASFHNAAHSHLAMAVRTGVTLGLHLKPPESVTDQQAEFRKRLWWTVYALELKMALDLGRPLAITASQISCPPPDRHQDDPYTHQGTNRFTANKHFIQLMLTALAVYATFQRKCSEALAYDNSNNSIYNNRAALELIAEAVTAAAQHFNTWQQDLPEPLKTKRLNSGKPLSTDRSMLNLKESVPLGMSRQRLFLELLFHTLSMNIYRAFICFDSVQQRHSTPLADANAASSVNHAITITNIVYQVLKESNLLAGFHETFQWQWNATITLIGFIFAFPNGPLTIPARDALITAIEVFDIIGKYLGIACSAASVARDLLARIEYLISSSSAQTGNGNQKSVEISSFTSARMQETSISSVLPHTRGHPHFTNAGNGYGNVSNAPDPNVWEYNHSAEFASSWIPYPVEE